MRKGLLLSGLIGSFALLLSSCGGGLKSSNMEGFGPFTARAPYVSTVDYFGYVSPAVQPDGEHKGKDAYYLYFWVPAIIDEVGVSMYSPANEEPEEGDFKHTVYDTEIKKDSKAFFDTYIALEKMAIFSPDSIKDGGSVMSLLTTNDDSSEMDENPSGRSYNSLLRHESTVSDPLKALVRGVYRISFTSFRGDVKGSYVATVGTNIPGVVVASSLAELHEKVNAPEPAPAE